MIRLAIAAGALALVALALWWTYTEGKDSGRNEALAAVARGQQIAIEARDAEQARIEKEQQHAALKRQEARDRAAVDGAAAADATGRLLDRYRRAAGACANPASAAIGQAAAGPDMRADVLRRVAEAGRQSAARRDDDRASLAECEQRHDALTR